MHVLLPPSILALVHTRARIEGANRESAVVYGNITKKTAFPSYLVVSTSAVMARTLNVVGK
jgi:hypothetical protein